MAFEPGSLWPAIVGQTRRAVASGALQPIPTDATRVQAGGVRFVVRVVSRLRDKPKPRGPKTDNPFLTPEPDLEVGDASPTHRCLLNKFNVVDHHLLVVTREYEPQSALLTTADLAALWRCLREYDGLGFYNGGVTAGASQPHKHLQVVPLPLDPDGHGTPVDELFVSAPAAPAFGPVTGAAALPFVHQASRLDLASDAEPADVAPRLMSLYEGMMRALAARPEVREAADATGAAEARFAAAQGPSAPLDRQPFAYNFLLTRRWTLLVPRGAEHVGSTSVNALGFAGSLFARTEQERASIVERGPMEVLRAVAVGGGGPRAL